MAHFHFSRAEPDGGEQGTVPHHHHLPLVPAVLGDAVPQQDRHPRREDHVLTFGGLFSRIRRLAVPTVFFQGKGRGFNPAESMSVFSLILLADLLSFSLLCYKRVFEKVLFCSLEESTSRFVALVV